MKKLKIFLLLAVISMTSCQSNTYEEVSGTVIVLNPTYEANVKPIITANCVECHSPTYPQQMPFLETYDQVRNACVNGVLLCRIDNSSCGDIMPQNGRMPQINIDIINLWAQNGFPIQ